ncbi:MAG: pyridoxal-5'-phosphate-dependent protein subunit beta [Vicinamibacteraceae bacterium]|nr:pyridoxal-5'-phosphate-dependent protein subunit beta [Vicinamibacteraceae bacterium]
MKRLGLDTSIVDRAVYEGAVTRFRDDGILLPTFAQLTRPSTIPAGIRARLDRVDPDAPDALNLFRVHWYNDATRRGGAEVPDHVVLPSSLTGVRAPIVVALGDRFPMIAAHKVLAAYACLAPRVITGQFDPASHRALWPSTGNYCRGGVAISRIMDCHGVAILPEGMSAERFDWLRAWVLEPGDIIRTPGTESNVKEIYDKCAELERDPANVVFNQFCEFGNYLAHFACTGAALEHIVEHLRLTRPGLTARAYVSATGSAGTLAAGDYLKDLFGTRIVAVEALECPTLLSNGFGEHNIQGIGDKHVPLIHNVMNTDVVTAVSDQVTDGLGVLFSDEAGRRYLRDRRGVPEDVVDALRSFGLSSICNVVAAIKTARYYDLGPDEAVVTVATDGAAMYASEWPKLTAKHFGGRFDEVSAAEAFGRGVLGATPDHFLEMTTRDRERVFNLGYYTWVEQQGVSLAEFTVRRDQAFWRELRGYLEAWDSLITDFNGRTGLMAA